MKDTLEKLLSLPGTKPQFLSCPVHKLFIISTEQSLFHCTVMCIINIAPITLCNKLHTVWPLTEKHCTKRMVAKKNCILYYENLPSTVFSFSVPSSFLSSLFFNFPGASAIGNEEWKTNSFPGHSEACVQNCKIKQLLLHNTHAKKNS
jgi:hypothetical protein